MARTKLIVSVGRDLELLVTQMVEKTTEEGIEITNNRPLLPNADNILKKAMVKYFIRNQSLH